MEKKKVLIFTATYNEVENIKNFLNIVLKFEDLVNFGSMAKAREAGKLRTEGKDYIVEDGDVIEFMHS